MPQSNTMCTNCGNRGFRPSAPDKNGTPTYACITCGSIVYTLHDLMEAEKRKKERDYEA